MERVMYEPTEKQLSNWSAMDEKSPEIPTDEWFKERWKKDHHGKVTGWGMGKRNWVTFNMRNTSEYQRGIWQGRVDCAQGLPYSEERNENTYNLGYFRGYTGYQESKTGGWDAEQAKSFVEKYQK